MRVQLTSRDQKLFKLLLDFGFLSTQQINQLAFKGVDYRTVLRRLNKLAGVKLIFRNRIYKGGIYVWYLSKKGAALFGETPRLKSINKNTLEHDLKANDARIALDQLGCFAKWISAHKLKQGMDSDASPFGKIIDFIPDWLCAGRSVAKQKTVAIELELTYKGIRRMRSIFSNYEKSEGIDHVWYIVPTASFGKKLMKIATEQNYLGLKGKTWFVWSLLDDVLKNPVQAKVHFRGGICLPSNLFFIANSTCPQSYPPTQHPSN